MEKECKIENPGCRSKVVQWTFYVSGVSLMLITLYVFYGWVTANRDIIAISDEYALMVFNSALWVFLLGLSQFFFGLGRFWITRVLAFAVFVMAVLTMIENQFHINLGIDELFFKYNLDEPMSYPGRPSQKTSLGVLCSSIVMLILRLENRGLKIFSFFCATIVLALPTIGLVSYFSGYEKIVAHSSVPHMSVFTLISTMILAISLWIALMVCAKKSRLENYFYSIFFAAVIFVATSSMSLYYSIKDFKLEQKQIAWLADEFASDIDLDLRDSMAVCRRMARRINVLGGYSDSLWKTDSSQYTADNAELKAFYYYDVNLNQIHGNGGLPPNILEKVKSKKSFYKILRSGKVQFEFDPSNQYLYSFVPVGKGAATRGMLVCTICLKTIFQRHLQILKNMKIYTEVLHAKQLIYSSYQGRKPPLGTESEYVIFKNYYPMRVNVFYSGNIIENTRLMGFENLSFTAGVMTSIMAGILIFALNLVRVKRNQLLVTNQELRQAKDKADAAAQAKGAFLATMSHEIRTPLNAVIGSIQLMAETEINETQDRYIKRIEFSSRALLSLINDILDYSKIESGTFDLNLTSTDLSDCIIAVVEGFDVAFESKNLSLFFEGPANDIPHVLIDQQRVAQVVANLINNALKFTEQGGIHVRLSVTEIKDDALRYKIEIIDSGIGIPLEKQEHLFERFTQVEEEKSRKYGGVGLGLSICKKIIDRLGGSIQISSESGKGSNFWFEIETQIDTNVAVMPPFDMKGKKAYVHLPEEKQMQAMVGYFQSWGAEVVNSLDELNKDNSLAIVEGTNQELIDEVAKREVRSIRVVDQVNDDEFSIDTPFCPRELKDKIVKLGVIDG